MSKSGEQTGQAIGGTAGAIAGTYFGPVGTIVGGMVGSVAGGLIGGAISGADDDTAMGLYQKGIAELDRLGAPPELSRPLLLKEFQQKGIYVPGMEKVIDVPPSELKKIKSNNEYASAQKKALGALQERGQVGLTPEDRAALNNILNRQKQETQAKQQQILQNMQQRGMGGSGAELIASLVNNQQSDEAAAQQAQQLSATASQNALQAIMQGGSLAGNMRSQDFNEQSQVANAQDVINRFNAQNQQSVGQRNVASQNEGQAKNLDAVQSIANANINMANQEQQRQRQAEAEQYRLALQRAQAYMGSGNAAAAYQERQENAGAAQKQQMGAAGIGIVGALAGSGSSGGNTTSTSSGGESTQSGLGGNTNNSSTMPDWYRQGK